MPTLLEVYLREMDRTKGSGGSTAEPSYYGVLQNLLNGVGNKLKPKVFCVLALRNQGAGFPDMGLYSANQLRRHASPGDPVPDQPPERGAIEAKPVEDVLDRIAGTEQVGKYWERYHLVLVTNFRQFLLIGRDQFGRREQLERFSLAETAEEFWELAAHPGLARKQLGNRLEEFVRRVLLHNAPLTHPRDLAAFLASYARDALARLEDAGDIHGTQMVRETLEKALDVTFEGEKGGHFFRSTLVQTLFYGLFSAWVLWCRKYPDPTQRKGFSYQSANWHLRLPVLRALFEQINSPARLGPLKLDELMNWAALTLTRVDSAAFFAEFREEHAVQYFYEPFLKVYDPELRKQLGVWYTPPEVVEYMVERVDRVLRDELGVADGLADESVYVLDPCAGTGSYLVATLKRIERTLREKGDDALVAADVKKAALHRVFGFEIMPAPLVVAHMQIGLLFESLGIELGTVNRMGADWEERPAVFLTNALTGWGERKDHGFLPLPELQDEMDDAREVKREKPILVVLGNPPYNAYAGMAVDEERDLSTAYRAVNRVRRPKGKGLNDLYVRFFRMAERRIAETTGRGVVCLISNYSWLDGLSFTGMRERYLDVFDKIWIDCLNGDKYKTGKLTPEGAPDPSIFSTEFNREGIQVGTAIALLLRKPEHRPCERPRFRHLWGKTKREQLANTADQDGETLYETLHPPLEIGLPFLPTIVADGYLQWPRLTEVFPIFFPGVKTSRDEFLVDIDRDRLERRLSKYFDVDISNDEFSRLFPGVMKSTARYHSFKIRDKLLSRGLLPENIVRYCYRPFDIRWLYWEPEEKLLDEKRYSYKHHVFEGNNWIEAREKQTKHFYDRGYFVKFLSDNFGNGLSSYFPLYTRGTRSDALFQNSSELEPNLSENARKYVVGVNGSAPEVFHHALATLHTPAFRHENLSALRQDWPRVPLPAQHQHLEESADLGHEVAGLLDPDADVTGVTAGSIRPELRFLGVVRRVGGGSLSESDLRLTVGWGFAGRNGVVMPGKGLLSPRGYTDKEREAIERGAAAFGIDEQAAFGLLGEGCVDVYANEKAYWSCVPARVWNYYLGGYQVIKKWLSYREYDLLGRPLKLDEARGLRDMVRRISALRLLEPALDANYRKVCENAYPWPAESR